MKALGRLGAGRQGVGAGSAYVALSFAVSGALTFGFQSLCARVLGPVDYGSLAILWSAKFLVVQVLWVWSAQTLGRHVAVREARGQDWRPVLRSVRRLQLCLLAVFLAAVLLAGPRLTGTLFGGEWWLVAAFAAAVAAYAPEYFRRGIFSGHRRFARLGLLHVAEAAARVLLAAVLLALGAGVAGAAAALVLAPLAGVLLVG
ncbi:MAG: oligosaccharide flippase family protein, partial [Rubrobacter sp.]|nr:oligosaccharide flippase family protein [Rubrobacter sp.]